MKRFGRLRVALIRPQFVVLLVAVACASLPVTAPSSSRLVSSSQTFVQPARNVISLPEIEVTQAHQVLADETQTDAPIDCARVVCIALTFDDGPNPLTTPLVLDALEKAHIPATFFVVGSRVPGNEALLQRMHAAGDELGNHSWSHPDLTRLSPEHIKQQVEQTQQVIIAAGVPAPIVFRPPYGAVNQVVEDNVPLSLLLWNEDPEDWAANTPQQVVQAVEASAKPGGIVDMHDIYNVTANALPQIVTDLTARGFHFVTVTQLLNLSPASRGIYYGHP